MSSFIRERVVPLAWLAAAALIIGAAAGGSAPHAHAFSAGASLRIDVAWNGGNCWDRAGIKPRDDDERFLAPFYVPGCRDAATNFQFATPGEWFGADPDIGNAFSVSCTVTNVATGRIVLIDYARKGDGHNATCLGKA